MANVLLVVGVGTNRYSIYHIYAWSDADIMGGRCDESIIVVLIKMISSGVLILWCCCCCCCSFVALKGWCERSNIIHPAQPPAQSDDVVPTATEKNWTYQMASLPPLCPGAANPVKTRAAVPSRATVEQRYQLEPQAGPQPDWHLQINCTPS